MSETFYVVPEAQHNALVSSAYQHRGYSRTESEQTARFSAYTARHGIRTHNAIKALHLDELFGSKAGGCVPSVEIEKKPSRFAACEVWDARKKLGQATAVDAMEQAIKLADQYGVGVVSVDNAFHYLWGGGYVMDAARRGYIAFTNCTAALAEVVPFGGKYPTLGTNPQSWGFPTTDAVGFPIVIDWATSVIAMGRVQQFQREGKELPPHAAVDAEGRMTTDPNAVAALTTFGAHKGYGLSLVNELIAAYIGGSLPTIRCRPERGEEEDKRTPSFYFQVIHPEALSSQFAQGRTQAENVKAVLADILGHGNDHCLLPGQMETAWAKRCDEAEGLLFSKAEVGAFNEIARECGQPEWKLEELNTVEV